MLNGSQEKSLSDSAARQHRLKAGLGSLGFGTAPLGGAYRATSEERASAAIQEALRLGITYFDTAPMYGHGLAEHRLGQAIRACKRDDLVISTKVGRLLSASLSVPESSMFYGGLPFELRYDYSYDGVMRSIEDSFQRLGLSYVDIAYIHDVSPRWHGVDIDQRFRDVIEGGYKALDRLKSAGSIGAIGVGVNDPGILLRFGSAATFDIFMIAGSYTLLNQSAASELLPFCYKQGISVAVAAPFAAGVLAADIETRTSMALPFETVQKINALEAVCRRHGIPLAAAALQFSSMHPAVKTVVTGFRSVEEVKRADDLSKISIPRELWSEMEAEKLIASPPAF
jgi:D-threo-aldose 1-dehydrogenase